MLEIVARHFTFNLIASLSCFPIGRKVRTSLFGVLRIEFNSSRARRHHSRVSHSFRCFTDYSVKSSLHTCIASELYLSREIQTNFAYGRSHNFLSLAHFLFPHSRVHLPKNQRSELRAMIYIQK